jgi:hypothetical protein
LINDGDIYDKLILLIIGMCILYTKRELLLKFFNKLYKLGLIGNGSNNININDACKHFDLTLHYILTFILSFKLIYDNYICLRNVYFDCYTNECDLNDSLVNFIYFYQLIFYSHELLRLLVSNDEENDFFVMMIHHITAIILLIFSGRTCLKYSGICILFIHDVVDIILNITMFSVDLEFGLISNITFPILYISFIVSRVILIPIELLRKEIYVGIQVDYEIYLHIFLWLLTILQIYWTTVLTKVLISEIKGEGVHDVRDKTNEKNKKE